MRAGVGRLTKNIRIIASEEGNIGGTLFVYHWLKEDEENPANAVDLRGSIHL